MSYAVPLNKLTLNHHAVAVMTSVQSQRNMRRRSCWGRLRSQTEGVCTSPHI